MADFLGRALAFPLQLNGRGGFKTVEGAEAVEHHLRALIESLKGEHLFEPLLGSNIEPFMVVHEGDLVAELVKDTILDWEDRIEENSLQVEAGIGDEGALVIYVFYQIRGEANHRTLAHQFRTL
jgi:hypothetical protein